MKQLKDKVTELVRRPEPKASFMAFDVMRASFTGYERNNFCQWLCRMFGEQTALKLVLRYGIGTSRYWPGSCVFWQIDAEPRIRGGKIMLYDAVTGRRVKEPFSHVQWVR